MLRSLKTAARVLRTQRGVAARTITTVAPIVAPRVTISQRIPAVVVSKRNFASGATASGHIGDVIAFPLADIGEGITECEVLQWFVKPGDTIKQFDKVCEVQSDKANVEITSRYDGVIQEVKYNVGEMAAVGAPLITIKLTTATANATAAKAAAASTTPAVAAKAAATSAAACPLAAGSAVLAQPRANNDVLASPVVRRMAREMNIELGRVKATGIKGQITKEDLLAFQAQVSGSPAPVAAAPVAPAAAAPAAAAAAPAKPVVAVPTRGTGVARPDVEVPVTGIQKVMVKTMTAAASIPTLGYSDEICVDKLKALRGRVKDVAEVHGVKLSVFAFIIKALSLALTKYPQLNAHVNSDCSVITQKGAHNIGLAMDTPKGLLVPNIKNVQDLSLLQIASELNRLQKLGKDGKLGPEDLKGGTITLSNIGTIGGTYCQPVLVVPEVAIAALGKIHTKAAFDKNGNVYPSEVFNIGWTADHRAVDGATVARFSNEMKNYIENPESMILF